MRGGVLTIEHIFPQNPDSKWRRDLSEGDYTEFKTLYTHNRKPDAIRQQWKLKQQVKIKDAGG